MSRIDEATREKALRLIERRDMSYALIAKRLGISPTTVSAIAKGAGIRPRQHQWTEEEMELMRLYYRDHGPTGMVKLLPNHQSVSGISHKAKEMGLETLVGPYGKLRVVDGGE